MKTNNHGPAVDMMSQQKTGLETIMIYERVC